MQQGGSPPRRHAGAPAPRIGEEWIDALPDYRGVPPLPPVRGLDTAAMCGPTEESNWVIAGRLLVGAYPASVQDAANSREAGGASERGVGERGRSALRRAPPRRHPAPLLCCFARARAGILTSILSLGVTTFVCLQQECVARAV